MTNPSEYETIQSLNSEYINLDDNGYINFNAIRDLPQKRQNVPLIDERNLFLNKEVEKKKDDSLKELK
jgi:hypothetical protein